MGKAAEPKLVMIDTEESEITFDEKFPIVEASKLSLEDEFLKHQPNTPIQEDVKKTLIDAIKSGLSDFRHPFVDPSVSNEKQIIFEKGNHPATGHKLKWWKGKLKTFMRNKNSRIGTKKYYCAFLGVIIKYLIEQEGYEISEAWEAVCDDSRKLGHYKDSEEASHTFEPTGSRLVWKWHDLANTFKIIMEDNGKGIYLASGYYYTNGNESSLGSIKPFFLPSLCTFDGSVVWIILDV